MKTCIGEKGLSIKITHSGEHLSKVILKKQTGVEEAEVSEKSE